jgi:hypothetical protein
MFVLTRLALAIPKEPERPMMQLSGYKRCDTPCPKVRVDTKAQRSKG